MPDLSRNAASAVEPHEVGIASISNLRVAIVHEWLDVEAGSEQVFAAFADAFPSADLWTLWRRGPLREDFHGRHVQCSWLNRLPIAGNRALCLPLMPLAWRTMPARSYDIVLSSSHALAHTVRFRGAPTTRYLTYVHTPARYIWTPELDDRGQHPAIRAIAPAIRYADLRLGEHVQSIAANSAEVQRRIATHWGRSARVIHPPVKIDFFTPGEAARTGPYLLAAGRWISYKRFDLAMQSAAELGVPLVVAGGGPLEGDLRQLASGLAVPVDFVVNPSDRDLRSLYRGATALLFPGVEDFGIVPVEAQACGTPVIARRQGGALETVIDGVTGALVDQFSGPQLRQALTSVESLDRGEIAHRAQSYSRERFIQEVRAWVTQEVEPSRPD